MENELFPRVILGLDISTACIGASIVVDNGDGVPKILKITHISPKISNKIKGIEALFMRKDIFEAQFISSLKNYGITDVVIEEPLLSSNNANTVATLLRFNGMISEAIYRNLHIVPNFISSYDARMFSYPELVALRKYNKKGQVYPLKHVKKAIKDNEIVLFGAFPFDIDKKTVMMNMVNETYPEIEWIYNSKGELKKENYDACDSLICALAYINVNRYGVERPVIESVEYEDTESECTIIYKTKIWDRTYDKKIVIPTQKKVAGEVENAEGGAAR